MHTVSIHVCVGTSDMSSAGSGTSPVQLNTRSDRADTTYRLVGAAVLGARSQPRFIAVQQAADDSIWQNSGYAQKLQEHFQSTSQRRGHWQAVGL